MRVVGQPVMMSLSDDPALIRSFRWLAWPYEWAARFRALLYRRQWLHTKILARPVISVGNLTVGGTGKTPVVIFLTEWLLAQGKRVAVLSRGYGRRSSSPQLLVSDGERVLVTSDDAGDEPYLIARRCPQAIVAVGADRFRLGQWVLERFPVDYFVLDDGFQHLSLHRTSQPSLAGRDGRRRHTSHGAGWTTARAAVGGSASLCNPLHAGGHRRADKADLAERHTGMRSAAGSDDDRIQSRGMDLHCDG